MIKSKIIVFVERSDGVRVDIKHFEIHGEDMTEIMNTGKHIADHFFNETWDYQ